MRLGAGDDVSWNSRHVGSPIEEKVADLEGCYVANRYI